MRPFGSITDEVSVGYDERFEARWRLAEMAGSAFMVLVVVAAFIGLLGRGPYSHHSNTRPGSQVTVDYEPVARYGNETMVTLHLNPADCANGLSIWLGSKLIEPMGLQGLIPRPVVSTPTA